MHKILMNLWIKTDHHILTKSSNPVLIDKKNRHFHLEDYAVSVNLKVKRSDILLINK